MILDAKVSNPSATRSATARLDRSVAESGAIDWLDRATAQFRAAMIFHIPEGYQDATGFHYGEPCVTNQLSISAERAGDFSQVNQF